jgi:hypothetical protein
MKFLFATLLLSGSVFAYTNSPATNERVRDPAWNSVTEVREPASTEVKSDSKKHDKKEEPAKPKN